jgi:hypothetical protein
MSNTENEIIMAKKKNTNKDFYYGLHNKVMDDVIC